jgi:hypothetical protein
LGFKDLTGSLRKENIYEIKYLLSYFLFQKGYEIKQQFDK